MLILIMKDIIMAPFLEHTWEYYTSYSQYNRFGAILSKRPSLVLKKLVMLEKIHSELYGDICLAEFLIKYWNEHKFSCSFGEECVD